MSKENEKGSYSLSAPLIFQCIGCRIVVGDSFSFVCSNERKQTMTLSSALNVKSLPGFQTSMDEYDVASSYTLYSCKNCEVSRVYFRSHFFLNFLV